MALTPFRRHDVGFSGVLTSAGHWRIETVPLGIFIRPHNQSSLENCLERARRDEVNYPEVGATLSDSTPNGYYEQHQRLYIGRGQSAFDRAKEGLNTWRAHMGHGVSLYPVDTPLQDALTVLFLWGTPGFAVVAPCRVIQVVDQPQRFAFAYGTLPHHPEIGEELFEIRIDNDEQVIFTISAFSRAGLLSVRSIGPLARKLQARATKGYLASLRSFVEAEGRPSISLRGPQATS